MRDENGDIWEYAGSVFPCVLTSLRYQSGTMGVEEAIDTIMGGVQCLNSLLYSAQIQTASS